MLAERATAMNEPSFQSAIYRTRFEIIQQVVADYFGCTVANTQRKDKPQCVVDPRRYIQYFAWKKLKGCTLATIGAMSGNGKPFNHATVRHNRLKVIQDMNLRDSRGRNVNPEVIEIVDELDRKIEMAFAEHRQSSKYEFAVSIAQL